MSEAVLSPFESGSYRLSNHKSEIVLLKPILSCLKSYVVHEGDHACSVCGAQNHWIILGLSMTINSGRFVVVQKFCARWWLELVIKRVVTGLLDGIGRRSHWTCFDRSRKNRRENYDGGLDVVFGTNPVLLALRAQKRHISRLWITEAKSSSQEAHTKEILKLASELRIPVRKEQAAALKRMSGDRPHQVS